MKTTADIVAEVSQKHAQAMSIKDKSHQAEKSAIEKQHKQEITRKENLLCIQNWGQLAMTAGAATMGVVVGNTRPLTAARSSCSCSFIGVSPPTRLGPRAGYVMTGHGEYVRPTGEAIEPCCYATQ